MTLQKTWLLIVPAWIFLVPHLIIHSTGHAVLGLLYYSVPTIFLSIYLIHNRFHIQGLARKAWTIALLVMLLCATPTAAAAGTPFEVSAQGLAAETWYSPATTYLDDNKAGLAKIGIGAGAIAGAAALCALTAGIGCAIVAGGLIGGAAIDIGAAGISGDLQSSALIGGAKNCFGHGSLDGCGNMLMGGLPACADAITVIAEGEANGVDVGFCGLEVVTIAPPVRAVQAATQAARVARAGSHVVSEAAPRITGKAAEQLLSTPAATRAYANAVADPKTAQSLLSAGIRSADDLAAVPRSMRPDVVRALGFTGDAGSLTKGGVKALGRANQIPRPTTARGLAALESKVPGFTLRGSIPNAARTAPAKGIGVQRLKALGTKAGFKDLRRATIPGFPVVRRSADDAVKRGLDDFAARFGREGAETSAKWFGASRQFGIVSRGAYVAANDAGLAGTGTHHPTGLCNPEQEPCADAEATTDDVIDTVATECTPDPGNRTEWANTWCESTQLEQELQWYQCIQASNWDGNPFEDPACAEFAPEQGFSATCTLLENHGFTDACEYKRTTDNPPEPKLVDLCIQAGFPETKCQEAAGMQGSFWYNVASLMGFHSYPEIKSGKPIYDGLSPAGDAVWRISIGVTGQEQACQKDLQKYLLQLLGHCGWKHAITQLHVQTWIDGTEAQSWTFERQDLVAEGWLRVEDESIPGIGIPATTDPQQDEEVLHRVVVEYVLFATTEGAAITSSDTYQTEASYEYTAKRQADVEEGDTGTTDPSPKEQSVEDDCSGVCLPKELPDIKGILQYWWIPVVLLAFLAVYRNGMLWRWTRRGLGRKPQGSLVLHKRPGVLSHFKRLLYGRKPTPRLRDEFLADGVPVVLPPNEDGTGPDYEALRRKLEDP